LTHGPIVPRVLIVEPAGNLGGSERALLDLIEHLGDCEVAVCCPPKRPLVPELKERSIRLFPRVICALHEKSPWKRLRAAVGVLRAALAFRPDVLYLNQSGCYRVALPAAILVGLPIVCHVRHFEDAAYLARSRPSPRRLRGLIAVSSAILEELRSFPELKHIEIHHLYDAYIPEADPLAQHVPERVPYRVACVGRVVPKKGQDALVEAVGCLKSDGEHMECWVLGDGAHDFVERLQRRAADAGVASRMVWLGTRDDIVAHLRTCKALICPSHREALGRIIFEAWNAGTVPIVYRGSGGAAEIISAADAGIIYDEQNPKVLAAAVATALHLDRDEVTRMIGNGRAWIAANCEPTRYGAALAAICARHAPRRHPATRASRGPRRHPAIQTSRGPRQGDPCNAWPTSPPFVIVSQICLIICHLQSICRAICFAGWSEIWTSQSSPTTIGAAISIRPLISPAELRLRDCSFLPKATCAC
jgi:glycosyltransferase involved in cell wall biosynthesis